MARHLPQRTGVELYVFHGDSKRVVVAQKGSQGTQFLWLYQTLLVLRCDQRGDLLVDAATGIAKIDDGSKIHCEPLPDFLLAVVRDGRLVPHLGKRLHRVVKK